MLRTDHKVNNALKERGERKEKEKKKEKGATRKGEKTEKLSINNIRKKLTEREEIELENGNLKVEHKTNNSSW